MAAVAVPTPRSEMQDQPVDPVAVVVAVGSRATRTSSRPTATSTPVVPEPRARATMVATLRSSTVAAVVVQERPVPPAPEALQETVETACRSTSAESPPTTPEVAAAAVRPPPRVQQADKAAADSAGPTATHQVQRALPEPEAAAAVLGIRAEATEDPGLSSFGGVPRRLHPRSRSAIPRGTRWSTPRQHRSTRFPTQVEP